MIIIDQFEDDHLPCVEFEHNDNTFRLLWTSEAVIGRLEAVEEGSSTLQRALKRYPYLIPLIEDPVKAASSVQLDDEGELIELESDEDDDEYTWITPVGALSVCKE